jgi:hypothetical protein
MLINLSYEAIYGAGEQIAIVKEEVFDEVGGMVGTGSEG